MSEQVVNVYDELKCILSEDFSVPEEVNDEDEDYGRSDFLKTKTTLFLKAEYKAILTGIGFLVVALNMGYMLYGLLMAMFHVDGGFLAINPVYYIFWLITPYLLWIHSTVYDFWNYHRRKLGILIICSLNVGILLAHVLYQILCSLLLPIMVRFPTSPDITVNNVFQLTRLTFTVLTIIPIVLLERSIIKGILNPLSKRAITHYKFNRGRDARKDKMFCYDMEVVRDLATGKMYTIKEKDRYLHSLANGVTGTGKTSSLFTVSIAKDMDKRVANITYQKKKVVELIKNGKVRMKEPMDDRDFNIDKFEVIEGDKDVLEKLKFLAPVAGMSAMAPNASFANEIYALAKQKNTKVNRLDPTLQDGHLKEGFIGFNPFYISPGISRLEWIMEMSRRAVLFADVTQAVYDANGQSDVYFASLNKNITTSVTMLILLTYSDLNEGKQPTPAAVQDVLNNFEKAKEYRDHLVKKYGKKNASGSAITQKGQTDVGIFQTILDIIDSEILGPGSEKIFDQSRGLRVIINSFLNNPLINNVLCCENSIDLDKALAEGQITVVNYALELGPEGIAFGLFYLLSLINAVFRRPGTEDTRLPHFFYVDELPVLLHPRIESCFSLFRQYKVAMFVAIQSLSQMQKQRGTVFLKDVLLGNCAHHFVFGRIATEEMRLYQDLAGTSMQLTEMKGTSETSLTTDAPSISYSRRESLTRENNIEGGDIRYLDFQEVAVITVDNGSPVGAFLGKTSFLPKHKRVRLVRYKVNWKKYYKENQVVLEKALDDIVVIQEQACTTEEQVLMSIGKEVDMMVEQGEKESEVKIEANEKSSFKDFGVTKASDSYKELSSATFRLSAGKPLSDQQLENKELTKNDQVLVKKNGEVVGMEKNNSRKPESVNDDGSFSL